MRFPILAGNPTIFPGWPFIYIYIDYAHICCPHLSVNVWCSYNITYLTQIAIIIIIIKKDCVFGKSRALNTQKAWLPGYFWSACVAPETSPLRVIWCGTNKKRCAFSLYIYVTIIVQSPQPISARARLSLLSTRNNPYAQPILWTPTNKKKSTTLV